MQVTKKINLNIDKLNTEIIGSAYNYYPIKSSLQLCYSIVFSIGGPPKTEREIKREREERDIHTSVIPSILRAKRAWEITSIKYHKPHETTKEGPLSMNCQIPK